MTRISRLEHRWEAMTRDEKVQEVATKNRLLKAAEDGDIETIGSIDVETYFGPAEIFNRIVTQIVETKERYSSLLGSSMVRAEMLDAAQKDHGRAVKLFKSMFRPHYTLLDSQEAELETAGKR